MNITKVEYNWRVVSDGCQTIDVSDSHTVGQGGVIEIEEHEAKGEGDKWFYYVRFNDGTELKIFNPKPSVVNPTSTCNCLT